MKESVIQRATSGCIQILNNIEMTNNELIMTLAQLLIRSGASITKKDIDIYDMNLVQLYDKYYSDNDDNDIGLGLILNGASIMEAIPSKINRDVTANKEIANDNQVSPTIKIPQENSSTTT